MKSSKKNVVKLVLFFSLAIGLFQQSYAQLLPGDIAILEVNADGTGNFAFLVMADISAGTQINFTDNGWLATNSFRSGEGIITWTAPVGGTSCGTIVQIDNAASGILTPSIGAATKTGSYNFSASGDQLIAYQNPTNMLAAIQTNGTNWDADATSANSSAIPIGLIDGTNCVHTIAPNSDNNKYSINLITNTKANLLLSINNPANWVTDELIIQDYTGTIVITDCPTLNDTNSAVDGLILASQPNPGTISSLVDTNPEALRVFDFIIHDYGTADGLPTDVIQITIKTGVNNTADWATVLQNAKISTDGGTTFITTGLPVISTSSIVIPITATNLVIPDNSSVTVSLFVYLNTTGIIDNQILEFKVDGNAHGFAADATGSKFATTFTGTTPSPVSNQIAITVLATELRFVQQPTNTVFNVAMLPTPTVSATDANGNIDVDYSTAVSLTSSGSMTGSPLAGTWTSGLATFPSVFHSVVQTILSLTATSGLLFANSSNFDILAFPAFCASELFISEYIEGTSNNKYIEIFNDTGADVDLSNYSLVKYTNGGGIPSAPLALSGILINGSTFIIENNSEALGVVADLSTGSTVMTFNGNDAIALQKFGVDIDVVGDPNSAAVFGANVTLVRQFYVFSGSTTYISGDWQTFTTNDITHLGTHTIDCSCLEPTVEASSISFTNVLANSMDISWTSGNGVNRIIVARAGLAPDFVPVDNSTYPANSSFGLGTGLGISLDNFVVYNGIGSSVSLTNLIAGTNYYFTIYEYGCVPGNENYYTTGTPANANQYTVVENVTNFKATCITNSQITLTWNLPLGNYDGILVTGRQSSTNQPSIPSCDGVTLNNPISDFTLADIYCGNTTFSVYNYNGTGNTVTITGLTAGLNYKFKVYVYSGTTWSSGTVSSHKILLADVTAEQAQSANLAATISWTNPICYDEILVLGIQAGTITATPTGDGSAYTASSLFGTGTDAGTNEFVVYKGIGTNVSVTGLTNLVNYCFKIFVRKGTQWSSGVQICITPANVTVFNPGELFMVGYDAQYPGGTTRDKIYLATLVDIKQGTQFKYVNSRYEAGAAANVRTNRWYGGGDNINADPGIINITYSLSAPTVIVAGSIISFEIDANDALNFQVNGIADANWTGVRPTTGSPAANIAISKGDQLWLLQGVFTSKVGYFTLNGNVLYGMTSREPWVPINQAVPSGTAATDRVSRIHPDIECFNLDMSGNVAYAYYKNGISGSPGNPPHDASKRNILLGILNATNWSSGVGSAAADIVEDFSACTTAATALAVGRNFCISAGSTDGTWVGDISSDWFYCGNWAGLTVPDNQVDVLIPNVTSGGKFAPDIDCASANPNAAKYSFYASCGNMTITNEVLSMNGYANDTLKVNGNLLFSGTANLNFDDGNIIQPDGTLQLSGTWDNQAVFSHGESNVNIVGSLPSSISALSGTETFYNLGLSNTNPAGITMLSNVLVTKKLTQNLNILNLNALNLEVQGIFSALNSSFSGNLASNLSFNGSGSVADIYFSTNFNLNNFTINRVGETANFKTNLSVANNLTITAGAVTLAAAKFYDVGLLINTPVVSSALTLKSDATGTASLIQQIGAVPAISQRYLTGNLWHYVFSPLDNVNIATLTTTSGGADNPNFYFYDETVPDFWKGYTLYTPYGWQLPLHSGKLLTNKGYIHRSTESYTYALLGGNLLDANKTFILSYTNSGTGIEPTTATNWDNFEGWNLLGNPYASAIDWDLIPAGNKTQIENFVYFYDDTQSKYMCYGGAPPFSNSGVSINGGTNFIPANQAFFVKALNTGNGTNFIIPKNTRVHSTQAFYRNANQTESLKLSIAKDNYKDETIIRTFSADFGVTDSHDAQFDAYKMFPWDDTKPQIYTKNNENSFFYAVNSLPTFVGNKIIPLGIYIGNTGEYTISWSENSFLNEQIWLEDQNTNIYTNLLAQPNYHFSQSAQTTENRFYVHFGRNHAPELVGQFANIFVNANENMQFTLPSNLFTDIDLGDIISISAQSEDRNDLYSWLHFNPETGAFSGIAPEAGIYKVKITATDLLNASAFTEFEIIVRTLGVTTVVNSSFSIYPNPTKGVFTIYHTDDNGKQTLSIYAISGQKIKDIQLKSEQQHIDISNLPKGIYILQYENKYEILRKKVVLE